MSRSRLNLAVLALIPVIALLLSACGSSGAATERTVGPVGPTTNGYYFDMSVSPSVIKGGVTSTVFVKVYVWDANGLPVSGVTVDFVAETSAVATTDSTGRAIQILEIPAGDVTSGFLYFSASVEDLELSNYVQIVP